MQKRNLMLKMEATMIKISLSKELIKNELDKFKSIVMSCLNGSETTNMVHACNNFIEIANNKKKRKNRKRRNEIKRVKNKITEYKDNLEKLILLKDCASLLGNDNIAYVDLLSDIFKDNNISSMWKKAREEVNEVLYAIFNKANLKVCPYCNRNYIPVVSYDEKNGKKKVLAPEMDHFYPKSKYPYLAFSFYNLIPICNTCNSRFKSDNVKDILNPYKEGFENNIKFKLNGTNIDIINLLSGSDVEKNKLNIELVKNRNITDEEYLNRCRESDKQFYICETYDKMHKQDAIDLVRKISLFRPSYSKSFVAIVKHSELNEINKLVEKYKIRESKDDFKVISSVFSNVNYDMQKLIFGNWIDESNDLQEPLSKFRRDIYQQFISPNCDYEPLNTNKCIEKNNKVK